MVAFETSSDAEWLGLVSHDSEGNSKGLVEAMSTLTREMEDFDSTPLSTRDWQGETSGNSLDACGTDGKSNVEGEGE